METEIAGLYKQGVSYEEFVMKAEEKDREEMLQLLNSMVFSRESVERIESISRKIKILVCAESWCPDCRVSVPVLEKMRSYNERIGFAIVGRDGHEEFFRQYSPDRVRIPTFVVCDADFALLGTFVEMPAKAREAMGKAVDDDKKQEELAKYRKGHYTEEIVQDILEIIL